MWVSGGDSNCGPGGTALRQDLRGDHAAEHAFERGGPSRFGITYLGIVATDPADVVFLAAEARRYAQNAAGGAHCPSR